MGKSPSCWYTPLSSLSVSLYCSSFVEFWQDFVLMILLWISDTGDKGGCFPGRDFPVWPVMSGQGFMFPALWSYQSHSVEQGAH